MSSDNPPGRPPDGPRFPLLERITAAVLLLVLAALGWVLVAAHRPGGVIGAAGPQVVLVLALLTAALLLVSVVALLHTR